MTEYKRSTPLAQNCNGRSARGQRSAHSRHLVFKVAAFSYAAACMAAALLAPSSRQDARNGDSVEAAARPISFFVSVASAGDRGRRRSGQDGGDWDNMSRDQRDQQREQERQARQQQRELERQARDQQRESERQERMQQREAERQERQQQWISEKEQRRSASDGGPPNQQPAPPTTGEAGGRGGSFAHGEGQAASSDSKESKSENGTGNGNGSNPVKENGRDNNGSDSASGPDTTDTAPPTTVFGWFDKINKPAELPKETETPDDKQTPKPVKAANNKPKQKKDKISSAPLGVDLPVFERPHVLAVNASAKTMARAQALGFKSTGVTSLASLNYGVTSLVAPPGMSAPEAQALLTREVPEATVAVNQTYAIFRTATGTKAEKQGTVPAVAAAPGSAVACGMDHCFGTDVVGWKPELRSCASGLKIGIIDTSVDVTHPAFARKKIELRHLAQGAVRGPDWHGTGVTALLAGDTSSGTPGLIPNASFYVADVFRAGGDNQPVSDTLSMLRAFDWLEAKNVKLINMSLSGPEDTLIAQAIAKLSAKGVIFIAAAGNGGPNATPSYPAAYDEVIAVTAIGKNLQSYRYANRGKYIDIAAPGVDIWTAQPGSKEGYHSGTSFAAPYVTAAVAAVYGALPSSIPNDVMKQLRVRDLGDPGRDAVYGMGLLVAPAACTGGQIAKAPAATPVQVGQAPWMERAAASPPPPASLGNPPAVTPSGEEPEILPWLSLNNTGD